LVDAQAAAEIEEEEAELARAAAAVARLVAPDSPSSSGSSSTGSPSTVMAAGNSNGSRGVSSLSTKEHTAVQSTDDEGSGPAAAKLRLLEQEVEEARQEVHSAPEDDTPAAGLSMRH
jgi:hypothetical protein